MYITVKNSKKSVFEEEVNEVDTGVLNKKSTSLVVCVLLVSLLGLNIAAKGVVYSIENIGLILRIPLEMLTLTTVAFATSLPEVMVTYSTSRKGEYDIAVGNIIGSNISNILLIVGFTGVVKTIVFDSSKYFASLMFLIFATLALSSGLYKKKIDKNFGLGFLGLYCVYLVFTFMN